MMDAVVFPSGPGVFSVSLRVAGEEVDVAGPFDDKMDAVDCAKRSVYGGGTVLFENASNQENAFVTWARLNTNDVEYAA